MVLWPLNRKLVFSFAGALVVLAGGYKLLSWTQATPQVSEHVDEAWNETIERLGIDAIYPPQEDFAVGDIYLFITDTDKSAPPLPLARRSLKLWHVDLTEAINDAYKDLYVFPDTLPRPKDGETIWQQKIADPRVFQAGGDRKTLPLVLFPGFSFGQVRSANIGARWLANVGLSGGGAGQGETSLELRIPFAETYGVPNLVATYYLDQFCSNPSSRPVCTEEGARRQLSMLVGDKITKTLQDKRDPTIQRYVYNVEIGIIRQVFLTRSIETVLRSGREFGVQAKASERLNDQLDKLKNLSTTLAADGSGSAENAALKKAVAEMQSQVQSALEEVSNAPAGAKLSLGAAGSNSIALSQNLSRPVAIGYRAARRSLFPE